MAHTSPKVLIPFGREHLQSTLEILSDPELQDAFLRPSPLTMKAQEEWFATHLKKAPETRSYFVIMNGSTHAGNCGLKNIDRIAHSAELFIFLDKKHIGKGLGLKALNELLTHGSELGLNHIYLHVRPDNLAAYNLYVKLGFKIEARLPAHVKWKDQILDMYRMSVEISSK